MHLGRVHEFTATARLRLKCIRGSRVAKQDLFLANPVGFNSLHFGVDTRIPRSQLWARTLPRVVRGKVLMIECLCPTAPSATPWAL